MPKLNINRFTPAIVNKQYLIRIKIVFIEIPFIDIILKLRMVIRSPINANNTPIISWIK